MSDSNEIKILIADDEEIARKRLIRLLAGILDVDVVGECHDGRSVLEWVASEHSDVDVLLLDIRMPGISGIETKALMPADGPYVIFTTAHQEHAVAAFDVGAVDYLLKPIEAGRLQRALDRARAHLGLSADSSSPAGAGAESPAGTVERIAVPTRQGIVLVDPREVSHAVFDGELVTMHTRRGAVLCDFTLQDLESRLGGDPFVRVHRRALLDLGSVARLEPLDTGGFIAHTHEGATVPVSRQAARRLRKRFGLS